jgi:hypothetical protein
MVKPKEIMKTVDTSALVEDDEDFEYYERSGVKYHRVTSIIKATSPSTQYALNKWREATPNHVEIAETARLRGNAFHYYTQQMLRPYGLNTSHLTQPEDDTYDEKELDWLLDMSARWIEVVSPSGILICEWPLYHEKCFFAGTFDILMSFDVDRLWDNMVLDMSHFDFIDDELEPTDRWMVDLKSYKKVRENTVAQIGAYILLCHANGLYPNRAGVFRANVDTESWQFVEVDIKNGIRLFQNHWLKFRKKLEEMSDV